MPCSFQSKVKRIFVGVCAWVAPDAMANDSIKASRITGRKFGMGRFLQVDNEARSEPRVAHPVTRPSMMENTA